MPNKDEKGERTRTDKPQESETRAPVVAPRSAAAGFDPQGGETVAKSEGVGPVGLEQIREILFGSLFRELERKVARSDVHMSTRSKDLEQEARRRTEVLEGHLRTEITAVAARAEHAFVEAADALRNIARENREAIGALEKRIAKAEEAEAMAQRDLRNQLLEQAKAFLDEVQHLRTELLATLQDEFAAPNGERVEERGGTEERPRH
jgi:hypothetical protein